MRRAAPLLALIVAGVGPAARAAPAQTAAEAVERGDRLIATFDTAGAIAAYRGGLAARPDDPELLWKASRALSNLAAETPGYEDDLPILEEAVALGRRAVEAGPDVARAHSMLAIALGRHGRALAHVHRIRSARTVIRLGREAHAEARRAIELDPWDFAPFTLLGVMAREIATVNPFVKFIAETFLGEYPDVDVEDGLEYLLRAKRLAPDDVTTRLELARTLIELDREEEARAELRAALSLPPQEALDVVEQRAARELLERIS